MILCLETLKKGASFINMAGTKHHCINPEIILTNVVRTRNKNVTPYYCSVSCLDPTVIANIANRCQLLKVCTSSHFLLTIWEFYIIFCSFVYCLVIYLNNLHNSHSEQSFISSSEWHGEWNTIVRGTCEVRTLTSITKSHKTEKTPTLL